MSSTCVNKWRVQVTFSICYAIKVHFLSLCQTDLPKFSFQWLIFRFLRLFISKFIHENNKFRFKSEFKRQAHICEFAALWAKNNPQLVDFTSTFPEVSIRDYKNCFHPVSSLAMILLVLRYKFPFRSCHSYLCEANTLQCKNKAMSPPNASFRERHWRYFFHLFHLGFRL